MHGLSKAIRGKKVLANIHLQFYPTPRGVLAPRSGNRRSCASWPAIDTDSSAKPGSPMSPSAYLPQSRSSIGAHFLARLTVVKKDRRPDRYNERMLNYSDETRRRSHKSPGHHAPKLCVSNPRSRSRLKPSLPARRCSSQSPGGEKPASPSASTAEQARLILLRSDQSPRRRTTPGSNAPSRFPGACLSSPTTAFLANVNVRILELVAAAAFLRGNYGLSHRQSKLFSRNSPKRRARQSARALREWMGQSPHRAMPSRGPVRAYERAVKSKRAPCPRPRRSSSPGERPATTSSTRGRLHLRRPLLIDNPPSSCRGGSSASFAPRRR